MPPKYLFLLLFLLSCAAHSPSQKSYTYTEKQLEGVCFAAPMHPIDTTAFAAVRNLNAEWVAFMPYAYLPKDSARIRWNHPKQYWGEKPEGLISCIRDAQNKGLKVMLKPHLWLGNGGYTGNLSFSKREEREIFQASYIQYVKEFAQIADSMNVELFCAATELEGLIKEDAHFTERLSDSLRKIYKGKLTYAANWDSYHKMDWKVFDFIGIDAYFPLCEQKMPNRQNLKKSWQKYIAEMQRLSNQHQKPILFTEYGYRDIDFAARKPWESYTQAAQNTEAQRICYEMLYECVWKQPFFAGGFVWKWYDETNIEKQESQTDYSPQGKAAEKLIQVHYGK